MTATVRMIPVGYSCKLLIWSSRRTRRSHPGAWRATLARRRRSVAAHRRL